MQGKQTTNSSTILKPIQLFFEKKDTKTIVHNSAAIQQIKSNFDPNKPIIVLVAAGMLGAGKSTWLNTLIWEANKNQSSANMFKVGHCQDYETEGLWIYPAPLCGTSGNTQIMLIDMEGMGSVDHKKEEEKNKSLLIKFYMLGMLLASVFTVHTNFRIDSYTIDHLRQSEMIFQQLRQNIKAEPPQIYILCKDTNELKIKDSQDPVQYFKNSCKLSTEFADKIKVKGRPKYPDGFMAALENEKVNNPYGLLENTQTLKWNQYFINEVRNFFKKKPLQAQPMLVSEFTGLIESLLSIINSSNYQELFKASLEQTLRGILASIAKNLTDQFKEKSKQMASDFDPKCSLQHFEDRVKELKEQLKARFKQEIFKTFIGSIEEFDAFKQEQQQFFMSLEDREASYTFDKKKTAYEEAERVKQAQNIAYTNAYYSSQTPSYSYNYTYPNYSDSYVNSNTAPQKEEYKFFKGGQFTYGGGRAPKGGIYMTPSGATMLPQSISSTGVGSGSGSVSGTGSGSASSGGSTTSKGASSGSGSVSGTGSGSVSSGGSTFYKGGQFTPGGGRAPKGGIWM